MASDEVIDTDGHDGVLRDFFDFGDGLIMPDKPFDVKKEISDYPGENDFSSAGVFSGEDSTDFFSGATPSPSSTVSSTAGASSTNQAAKSLQGRSPTMEFHMSLANDFIDFDFGDAIASAADDDQGENDFDFLNHDESDQRVQQQVNVNKAEKRMKSKCSIVQRRDNIQIFTDLNAPLQQIRQICEDRFGVNLSEFGIWLQNSSMLDDRSTLSEQCIEGQGVVKVELNIQPVNDDGYKKINILDVLKVDSGTMVDNCLDKTNSVETNVEFRSSDDEDDDFFDEDDDVDVESSTPLRTTSCPTKSPPKTFIESVEFGLMRKRFSYPFDISEWTRLHTLQWAKWVNRTFKGISLNEEHWSMDGQELAAISEEDFTMMVGYDPGNHLWSHFSVLRQTGVATVPSHFVSDNRNNLSSVNCVPTVKRTFDPVAAAERAVAAALSVQQPPAAKKQRVILGKYEEAKVFINSEDSSSGHRSGNNGNNVQLWKFLLDILTDYRHRNIIRWSLAEGALEGEFIMCEPEGVAKLWGQQKGKATMNYEKLSRALRYYKGGNILDKVHNKKFTYRFVCDLRDIVGFSATELDRRVREQVEAAEQGDVKNF